MNIEPESSAPRQPGPTQASTPAPALDVPETPKAALRPGESITQTESGPEPTQESGLPLSPPVKLPGFENIDALLTSSDLRTRGVGVMMIREQTRLSEELKEKAPFERKYYEETKAVAVLQEQLTTQREQSNIKGRGRLIADVWFGLSMCAAGFFASHADTYTSVMDAGTKKEMYLFAFVAIAAGVFTKWWAA